MLFGVGRVADGQVDAARLMEDAFIVGEGVEGLFSVVLPHAAGSHPAETHVGGGQVDDRVVDTAAAEGYVFQDAPLRGLVLREEIEGQGLGAASDELLGLLYFPKGKHRQDGGDAQGAGVGLAPGEDGLAGKEPGEAGEVFPIDNMRIVLTG